MSSTKVPHLRQSVKTSFVILHHFLFLQKSSFGFCFVFHENTLFFAGLDAALVMFFMLEKSGALSIPDNEQPWKNVNCVHVGEDDCTF